MLLFNTQTDNDLDIKVGDKAGSTATMMRAFTFLSGTCASNNSKLWVYLRFCYWKQVQIIHLDTSLDNPFSGPTLLVTSISSLSLIATTYKAVEELRSQPQLRRDSSSLVVFIQHSTADHSVDLSRILSDNESKTTMGDDSSGSGNSIRSNSLSVIQIDDIGLVGDDVPERNSWHSYSIWLQCEWICYGGMYKWTEDVASVTAGQYTDYCELIGINRNGGIRFPAGKK